MPHMPAITAPEPVTADRILGRLTTDGDVQQLTGAEVGELLGIFTGAGTPESVVAAPVGSLYLRTDGSTSTTLYVKTSGTGNTGWTAK
jgi:hypothetical protein